MPFCQYLKMKKTLFVLFSFLSASFVFGQDDETAALTVAKQLFVAMETNDGALAASLFIEGAQLQTVHKNKQGETVLSTIPVEKLVEVFGQEKEQAYSEPIWNERILIDGDYAVVWVDYAFYLGNTFSHCGVDIFQMMKQEGEWKIFGLTDTRRKEGCEVPSDVKARYKE